MISRKLVNFSIFIKKYMSNLFDNKMGMKLYSF